MEAHVCVIKHGNNLALKDISSIPSDLGNKAVLNDIFILSLIFLRSFGF